MKFVDKAIASIDMVTKSMVTKGLLIKWKVAKVTQRKVTRQLKHLNPQSQSI